ncbi:unnamed protein product [Didymodactylos carnosus]|uniref:BED-type domain-containing protein n=1 Tax=Didymodactylos carnosus TaxID=1234261 RepID=A0A8S2SCH5_9BILA|nr:unnamed protein product [Didymodactylos carnosus]CAF4222903.1 unnamed protein product [Didymodactylos carnosus]
MKHAQRVIGNAGVAKCGLCDDEIKISNKSTTSLRYHLIVKQDKSELKLKTMKQKQKCDISLDKKQELDDLCVHCIIKDGRSFGDLKKHGILKLLRAMIPGKLTGLHSSSDISLK